MLFRLIRLFHYLRQMNIWVQQDYQATKLFGFGGVMHTSWCHLVNSELLPHDNQHDSAVSMDTSLIYGLNGNCEVRRFPTSLLILS